MKLSTLPTTTTPQTISSTPASARPCMISTTAAGPQIIPLPTTGRIANAIVTAAQNRPLGSPAIAFGQDRERHRDRGPEQTVGQPGDRERESDQGALQRRDHAGPDHRGYRHVLEPLPKVLGVRVGEG